MNKKTLIKVCAVTCGLGLTLAAGYDGKSGHSYTG